jgi:NodT family efflux transporter outer membrane factor (OMF) lipoprotein
MMRRPKSHAPHGAQAGIATTLCLLLASCAVGPDFQRPAAPEVADYTSGNLPASTVDADGQPQNFVRDAGLPSDWWRMFGSPEIDEMVNRSMLGNPTVAAAEASLRQSQDNLRAGYGVFFPQIDLGASGARQLSAPALQGSSIPGSIFNIVTLTGSITYALDLFGGQRRAVEGLRARRDYARYETSAARLALQANVVETAIARAAYASQIESTEHMLQLEDMQLRQVQAQVDSGVLGYASVLAVRSQMSQTEAQLAQLHLKFDQAGHLLVNLQGEFPARLALPDIDFECIALPRDLPVSLPSDLVRRRPDILASEAAMHSASADIGVAAAAMFPSISLTGNAGAAGTSLHDLPGDNGKFWSAGAGISVPVFRGGSLWFGRKAAIDAYEGAAANYRQTVLGAFTDVANALKALEHDAETVKAQGILRDNAQETVDLLFANYNAGLVPYMDILTAEIQLEQANIAYVSAAAQRHQDTVALFSALGGGWWAKPDSATDASALQVSRSAP